MNEQRKTELRVGITVVLGIILVVWVIGWAKNISISGTENRLKVRFQNVSGLEVGDNVTINGVRKGFVESISVDGAAVLVELELESGVRIPKGSKFYVTMLDLMGGKKVDIKTSESEVSIELSEVQTGEFQYDIPEVMSFVGSVSGNIPLILSRIDTALVAINSYLKDDMIKNDLKRGMNNMAELAVELRELLAGQRDQIDILVKNGIRLTENADSLTMSATNFLKENQDSVTASIASLNKLLKQSDKLILKLDGIIDETTGGKNNLGKLLYDETTYNDLRTTLKDAKDLLDLVKKQIKNEGLNVRARIELF
ncbi:MAG: mammalian cell entry protein [Ignavibacteriaceae bacterium]|nr:MAG: MCE family protein [Chlorobiota bacterium]GJQ33553.1 MAG: mammalian cell entry protein [Ignavibacteriaceae bacterium]